MDIVLSGVTDSHPVLGNRSLGAGYIRWTFVGTGIVNFYIDTLLHAPLRFPLK